MECGWGSPEQIAACLHLANRWFQVLVDIAGLGSFALITLLVWLFRRLRKDLTKWEDEAAREKELRHYAEQAATHAEHRATLAESVAARDRATLDDVRRTVGASEDELRTQVVTTHAALAEARARIDSALELTSGDTGKFWSRDVGNRLNDYDRSIESSIPILLFGNQKGGVGKSEDDSI
jgi:hypothetical protein